MTQDRFEELLSMLLDDDISAEQLDELVEIVAADQVKLQRLREHLVISDRLSQYEDEMREEHRFLSALEVRSRAAEDSDDFVNQVVASIVGESFERGGQGASLPSHKPHGRWQPSRRVAGWVTVLVALLLFGGMLILQIVDGDRHESQPRTAGEPRAELADVNDSGVAVLTRIAGLQGIAGADWRVGETIPPGLMAWDAGLMQLEFYCGATVVVEGPAEIEILDQSRVVCRLGRLRAHIPQPARGFAVLSPSFELVDLGTEFGLNVSDDGAAEVHVFDGKVELYDVQSNRNSATKRELNAGNALTVDRAGTIRPTALRDADFITPSQLSQMTDARRQERLRHWRAFRESLRNDPRMVAYFPFDRIDGQDRLLLGYGAGGTTIEGAIVGCEWSEGRWPGKTSLQFKRPGDRVRIAVPGEFKSLTYSVWVRVDGLDRRYNSLLLSDGFSVNSPHWQIRQNGNVALGMRHSETVSHSYVTEPIFDLFRLGQWVHLATVYDADQACVSHYVNGESVAREPLRQTADSLLTIGDATIGNWSVPTNRHRRSSVRNLNGCLDELIIFGEALDDQEVRRIYEVGQP